MTHTPSPESSPYFPSRLIFYHALCMLLGFGFFTSTSVLLALYRRYLNPYLLSRNNSRNNNSSPPSNNNNNSSTPTQKWFDYHLNLQLIGFLFSIVGVVLAFIHGTSNDESTPQSATDQQLTILSIEYNIMNIHAFIGLIVVIITSVIQPMFGLPEANLPLQEKRLSLSRHSLLGRSVLLLAYTNIFIGLYYGINAPSRWILVFGIWASIVYSLIIIASIMGLSKDKAKKS